MTDSSRSQNSLGDSDLIRRRDLLKGGGAATLGLGIGQSGLVSGPVALAGDRRSVIVLRMVGGASPWETFDPKPDAPAQIRGPFGSISTAVPGVRVSEFLPRIARRMDNLALIRSVYHEDDPTHDVGLRLLETGWSEPGQPHVGTVAALQLGSRGGMPPFVVLPNLVGTVEGAARVGGLSSIADRRGDPFVVGADAGSRRFDPDRLADRVRGWGNRSTETWDWNNERPSIRDAFGSTSFGRNCWLAGRLVGAGTRLVVVNMATDLFDQANWDAHGRHPFRTWDDYRNDLLPAFDQGFSGLVDFLRSRDLLDSTLVVASGEMGRTPWINESGGRDHWPGVWSALVAGGGTLGGQVIGASDRDGRPRDRPVHVSELVATIAHGLGLPQSDPSAVAPVADLFG